MTTTPKPPTDAAWVPCSTCGTVVLSPCMWVEGKPYHQKCVPGTGTISASAPKPPTLAERIAAWFHSTNAGLGSFDKLITEVAALEADWAEDAGSLRIALDRCAALEAENATLKQDRDFFDAERIRAVEESDRLRANEAAFCGCGDACNREGSLCPVCADALRARIAAMEVD